MSGSGLSGRPVTRHRVIFTALLFCTASWAQIPVDYYGVADTGSTELLRASLHIIIDDHTQNPYADSQLDTWDVLEEADQDQDQPGNITTLYRNASFPKQGGGNDFYNREHTWPSSYGFPDRADDNYPYTDMHALYLADADYNSDRENRPFEDCASGCTERNTSINDGRGGGTGNDGNKLAAITQLAGITGTDCGEQASR